MPQKGLFWLCPNQDKARFNTIYQLDKCYEFIFLSNCLAYFCDLRAFAFNSV